MILSIIIVNYNVKNLLRECLLSIQKSTQSIDTEIWVVDNASNDQSVDMIKTEFPNIHLIENSINLGFAKANNQALEQVSGEYVLFLNPDTKVNESSIESCLLHAKSHPKCGGIGVRMIDSDGHFLKESKRGFPTPWASFCRFSYLSTLFPKSAVFNRYYMGHLEEDKRHKIDILAGAFIFIKKDILMTVGGFDDTYFMFGEDIDLSHRIQQAGYHNFYLGDTSILHHKGKSTNRKSTEYIDRFFGAMKIFVKTYYPKTYPFYAIVISAIIFFKKMMLKIRSFNLNRS